MGKQSASTELERNHEKQLLAEQEQINRNLKQIKHKILVLSGKGGVGKSTVAANLAVSLSLAGKSAGLLDIDIYGPSIPKILNLEGKAIQASGEAIVPVEVNRNLKVMSIGFLLRDSDDAVIWRGPMKYQMIKQFLRDVQWGELDYLIIDSPPGTGDEPLSIIQLLGNADGAIIVTTPQQVALSDVRKSISFCRNLNLPVLGVIENMSGFVCPKCGERTDIFKSGGGQEMALQMGVTFLERIPIDPQIVLACDLGEPYVQHHHQGQAVQSFIKAIKGILDLDEMSEGIRANPNEKGEQKMRIAIPLFEGKLSQHFGHCEKFAIIEVDRDSKQITGRQDITPPDHQPGVLPRWLHGIGVNVIIASGMGQRAQQLFAQNQIEVVTGAIMDDPEDLVSAYLNQALLTGENVCDH